MNDRLPHPLRTPCAQCGGAAGRIKETGSQDCVYCLGCDRFQYNAPRAETGKPVRSVRSARDVDISPGLRAHILFERAGGCCEICHNMGAELHVGHLLSVAAGRAEGMSDADLNSADNLAAMLAAVDNLIIQQRSPSNFLGMQPLPATAPDCLDSNPIRDYRLSKADHERSSSRGNGRCRSSFLPRARLVGRHKLRTRSSAISSVQRTARSSPCIAAREQYLQISDRVPSFALGAPASSLSSPRQPWPGASGANRARSSLGKACSTGTYRPTISCRQRSNQEASASRNVGSISCPRYGALIADCNITMARIKRKMKGSR